MIVDPIWGEMCYYTILYSFLLRKPIAPLHFIMSIRWLDCAPRSSLKTITQLTKKIETIWWWDGHDGDQVHVCGWFKNFGRSREAAHIMLFLDECACVSTLCRFKVLQTQWEHTFLQVRNLWCRRSFGGAHHSRCSSYLNGFLGAVYESAL